MEIYTIGFTKKSAEGFFGLLRDAGVSRLIDVRLNNQSQLAGFAKRDDLAFFLREICRSDYVHQPLLAPDQDSLKSYRGGEMDWETYERRFMSLLAQREVELTIDWSSLFDSTPVLLCSEHTPERCHRRLVIEYLNSRGWDLTPIHL